MKQKLEKSFALHTNFLNIPTGMSLSYTYAIPIMLLVKLSSVTDDLEQAKEMKLKIILSN